jgi:hypothetical protein
MKPKFSATVYQALKAYGLTNVQIARELGVNESSARRGLKDAPPKQARKVTIITIEE